MSFSIFGSEKSKSLWERETARFHLNSRCDTYIQGPINRLKKEEEGRINIFYESNFELLLLYLDANFFFFFFFWLPG